MSCVGDTCGTGTWVGPKPGDPDNNVTISANVVFGGIKVRWTYPNTNKAAVAHWTLYRGLNADFTQATELAVLSASNYLDSVDDAQPTQYYYWVQMMTVHGTTMDPIGPASTISVPRVQQTLESLTGQIDAGKLAQALKTDIAGITDNKFAILAEIQDRLNSNVQLSNALAAVQSDVGAAMTYILDETTARTDADTALVTQVNALAVGIGEAKAAIVTEQTVRATETLALADRITAMVGSVDDAEAAIVEETRLRVEADSVLTENYIALQGRVNTTEGAIVDIKSLNISEDSALATKLSTLTVGVDTAVAAINTLDSSLALGTHALAQSVKTVEAKIDGDVATGQIGLTAEVNAVTGAIDAMLVAKVQVNGLIGGFGIHNDGVTVEAGFDVDTFWVGRTGPDAVKPFIIAGGKVYMDKAIIKEASIETLMLAGEAVTVPIVSTVPDRQRWGSGEGNWIVANEAYIELKQAGLVYILHTSAQGFRKNDRYWGFRIRINGAVHRQIMGRVPNDAPVISATVALPAGVHRIEALWSAHSDVVLGYSDILMMGVKK